MDLEKLERLAELVLDDLSEYSSASEDISNYSELEARVKNLMNVAQKCLADHTELFATTYRKIDAEHTYLRIYQAKSIIRHLLDIIKMEKTSEKKIEEMKIFDSANEKLKQAGLSFRNEDSASVFHNLNTVLELVLKDKLGIPITITKINTSRIIDILVKHKVEPHLYLAEAKKRIVMIDNKVKHQGYSPSKIDCINGIKAMEELISRLRNKEIKLTEGIRNKIYEGL